VPVGGGPGRSYPLLSPSGDFRIQAPPGSYWVSALAPGYGDTADPPQVEVGASEGFVKLTLQASSELRGRVVEAQSRRPVAGAEVVVFRSPFGAGRWATLQSDGDGRFELSAAPRSGLLAVRKDGFGTVVAPLTRVLGGAEGHEVEIPLSPGKNDVPMVGPYEGVGMQLDFSQGVHVSTVFPGSPAEGAGISKGDGILAVAGQTVSGLSPSDVTGRIMGPSGTVVHLSLQRAGESVEVDVRRQAIQF